jgi:hypothetical protein
MKMLWLKQFCVITSTFFFPVFLSNNFNKLFFIKKPDITKNNRKIKFLKAPFFTVHRALFNSRRRISADRIIFKHCDYRRKLATANRRVVGKVLVDLDHWPDFPPEFLGFIL